MRRILCALALLTALPTVVHAGLIWDTGTPSGTSQNGSDGRAAQIVLASPTVVTGIEQFLRVSAPGTVVFRLYSDADNLPGSLIFSATTTLGLGATFDWRGVSGLSWAVGPGTYWVAIEERGTAAYTRLLGLDEATRPPNPLVEALLPALDDPMFGSYLLASGRTGWRIFGDVSAAVPEPGTAGLLVAALAFASLAQRRRLSRPRATSA
jgi:hypothetical protein